MELIKFSAGLIKEIAEGMGGMWLVIGVFAATLTGGLSPVLVVGVYLAEGLTSAITCGMLVMPGWLFLAYSIVSDVINKYKRHT